MVDQKIIWDIRRVSGLRDIAKCVRLKQISSPPQNDSGIIQFESDFPTIDSAQNGDKYDFGSIKDIKTFQWISIIILSNGDELRVKLF